MAGLAEAMGGTRTVVASLAAAMLLYAGQSKAAAASTLTLRGSLSSLIATLRGLSLSGVAAGFRSALAGMRSSLASTLTGMKLMWSTAWSTMATVTRTAMVAVKAAIVSTGIGLIIVGIGEALGALYSWFMGNADAAREAAQSAREFEKTLNALNISLLVRKRAEYSRSIPLQIEAARAAEREAAAARARAEAEEELARRIDETRQKMADMQQQQREQEREQYLSGLDTEMQIRLRLIDAGGYRSVAELQAAIRDMERGMGSAEPGDEQRYATLLKTYNKIQELRRRQQEQDERERARQREEDEKTRQSAEEARAD